jgi:small subunit ribosomal protein S27e
MTGNDSSFLRVKCADCGNEQIIFGKGASKGIKCLVCDKQIAKSTGGKTLVTTEVVEVVDGG